MAEILDRRCRRYTPVYAIGCRLAWITGDREVLSVTTAEAVFDDSRVDLAASAVSHGHGVDPIPLQLLENGKPIEVRRVTPSADGTPVHTVFQVSPPPAPQPCTASMSRPLRESSSRRTTSGECWCSRHRGPATYSSSKARPASNTASSSAHGRRPGLDVDAIVRGRARTSRVPTRFIFKARQDADRRPPGGFPVRPRTSSCTTWWCSRMSMARSYAGADGSDASVRRKTGRRPARARRQIVRQGRPGDTALEEALPLLFTGRDDAILPASSRGTNRVSLTAAGEAHPIMQLASRSTRRRGDGCGPALASTSPLGAARPGATVLAVSGGAGGGARALVAVQRYGRGRSMIFTGEASWRWRMMLPSSDRAVRHVLAAGDSLGVTVCAGSDRDRTAGRCLSRGHRRGAYQRAQPRLRTAVRRGG